MPFREVSAMDERKEFVRLALVERTNMRLLCRRFGVSPTTGYKWLERYQFGGEAGLVEHSRRPHSSPRHTAAAIEAAVVAVRKEHPAWGGRKIAAVLKRKGGRAPAPSTVTAILRRHGFALGEHGGGAAAYVRFEHAAPNDLWQMDFKGHVAMRQGRLHPLTVLDDHSRFAIVLAACADERTETVKPHLVSAFRRYGLPWRMIMDNGSPWGDGPATPFTPLGVWLIEQDITIAHARPHHPQTMGKDERFHRSLKAEVLAGPPFDGLDAADLALARWRSIYNTERPHEGIGLDVPASRYRQSPRPYAASPTAFDYAPQDRVRRVQQAGQVSFLGRDLRVPKAFCGKAVAFRPTDTDGVFDVVFRTQFITRIDISTLDRHA